MGVKTFTQSVNCLADKVMVRLIFVASGRALGGRRGHCTVLLLALIFTD